jgi:hypothetical protein
MTTRSLPVSSGDVWRAAAAFVASAAESGNSEVTHINRSHANTSLAVGRDLDCSFLMAKEHR